MWRPFIAVVTILALVFCGFCCATTNPDGTPSTAQSTAAGTLGGAAIGAALGAIIGAALGDPGRGAAIGAAAGALAGGIAGFAYGKHREQIARDRAAAEAMYSYKPEQGEKVVIENVAVNPQTTPQDSDITLTSTYTVLNGDNQPMEVAVVQKLLANGKPMGQPYIAKDQKISGTYEFTLPTKINANAQVGRYTLITQVDTPNARDQKSVDFIVAQKAAANER